MTDLLFVYGTLQRHGGAHHLLAGHVTPVGAARLQGRLFEVAGYPGAVLSSDPGDRVHGELYRMHDAPTLLARLDAYEEIGPQFSMPHEYRRETVPITDAAGKSHTAWTYLYARDTGGLAIVKKGRWSPAI